jgi:hypothetical protein
MNNSDRTYRKSIDKEANAMASNDIEVLDPAATVEKHKETESGVGLDRRHFLTALGVAGAAASVMAGADLLSSGPTAFAQFQPPIGGYKQLDVMNFLMNIKYLKATLYAYMTTGADIPNYPTYVTYGTGQIFNPLKSAVSFPTQQITDLFNEMYYDELNQLVDLRNLIGNVTGDVLVISRPSIDLAGTKSTSTTAVTISYQQAIGLVRMLEDLSVQAFAGAVAYLTGANLAYVSQILATDGYHAGALRLISIQQNIPYIGTGFLTTTAAGAQSLNTFSAVLVPGLTSLYLTAPTNPPILGSAISGVNIPQGAVITAYTPVANSTFTAIANSSLNPTVLTEVSSIAGLAQYQPVSGTNIPTGAYITASGTSVTMSAAATGLSTVAPTGFTTNGSVTITGVSSVSGVVAGAPISGTGIQANTTVANTPPANSTNIILSLPATATSQTTFSGLLTNGNPSITSVSSTSGLVVGQPITSTGTGVPSGTTISAIGNVITMSNNATVTTAVTTVNPTGTLTNGSATISSVSSFTNVVAGEPISGTGIPPGTTITAVSSSAKTITMSGVANAGAISSTGTLTAGSNTITGVSSLTGIAVGQPIAATGLGISQVTIPAGTIVGSINSGTSAITLSPPATVINPFPTGIVTSGSTSVTSVSSTTGLAVGQSISGNFIPAGTTIAGISGSTVTLSAPATGSSTTAETLIVVAAITGTVTSGSTSLTSVSPTTSLAVGQTISGTNIVPGTIILAISSGTVNTSNAASYGITGTVLAGSRTVSLVPSTTGFAVGQTIAGLNLLPGTKITAVNPSAGTLTLSNASSGTNTSPLLESLTISGGTLSGPSVFIGALTGLSNTVTSLSFTAGLAVGQLIVGNNLPGGTTVTGVDSTANTLTLSNLVSGSNTSPTAESLTIYSAAIAAPSAIIGAVTGGSNTVTSLTTATGVTTPGVAAAGLAVGQAIAGPNIPLGTIITSVNATAGTLTMSNAATGTSSALLESLTITGVSITLPLTPLTLAASAYYGAFAGLIPAATTLPGIVTVGNNVVSGIPPLTGLAIGQPIFGNYIPVGTTVTVIGAGAASATNPGAGTVTISNAATGSSFTTENIVIDIPTSAILTVGLITAAVPLTVTTTQSFTSNSAVTLKIPTTVTVTVGRSLLTISVPAAGATPGLQTLTMLTGDIMDVEPFDVGTAAAAAMGPVAVAIPPSTYSTGGPTNPTVYQGFFNTASAFISSASPGTATANTPPGFAFARSFGQTLSVLLGSTQFNPPTSSGGFFPGAPGVGGPINVNTDQ